MYITFDETPDNVITKERETCFISGSNGEPLPQYITDARDKHRENSNALHKTMDMFKGDEPKRRLHGKVVARFEQERKWVKHFDACIHEHKKGTVIAKLKEQLETAKKEAAKKEQALRNTHATAMDELRKQCRVANRKEWDDEIEAKAKAKAKTKKKKKAWNQWWIDLWKPETEEEIAVVRANMVAKEPVVFPEGMSAHEKRVFYMAKRGLTPKKE